MYFGGPLNHARGPAERWVIADSNAEWIGPGAVPRLIIEVLRAAGVVGLGRAELVEILQRLRPTLNADKALDKYGPRMAEMGLVVILSKKNLQSD